jgi:hypothetical protein
MTLIHALLANTAALFRFQARAFRFHPPRERRRNRNSSQAAARATRSTGPPKLVRPSLRKMSRTSSQAAARRLHAVVLGVRSLRQRKLFQALGGFWSRSTCRASRKAVHRELRK